MNRLGLQAILFYTTAGLLGDIRNESPEKLTRFDDVRPENSCYIDITSKWGIIGAKIGE